MLIFVDCEAWGGCPSVGQLTEFGAVSYPDRKTFHGVIIPDHRNPLLNPKTTVPKDGVEYAVFKAFEAWLGELRPHAKRHVFVSDNPAYDWQWINDGFWRCIGRNPFGHSARRIGDFYSGMKSDFYQTQEWKNLRVTPHTHHPVDDAMGNLEAFETLVGLCRDKKDKDLVWTALESAIERNR